MKVIHMINLPLPYIEIYKVFIILNEVVGSSLVSRNRIERVEPVVLLIEMLGQIED